MILIDGAYLLLLFVRRFLSFFGCTRRHHIGVLHWFFDDHYTPTTIFFCRYTLGRDVKVGTLQYICREGGMIEV